MRLTKYAPILLSSVLVRSEFSDNTRSLITVTKVAWPIKLYAGCDVTMKVYDQGQDAEAMTTGFFDEINFVGSLSTKYSL